MTSQWKAVLAAVALSATLAQAQGNLEVNTPAISAVKSSMAQRHVQLAPLYTSGAVGLKADGSLAIHDANAVPLAQRGKLNALVAAENGDRSTLYREIAAANGHPEWADDIRRTFAQRWIDKAPAGWWVESQGGWARK
ncbi:YdbL family protein [Denitromonas sp.]|uniref:YdbL family protein n=1 Tax=Denitromonas sp. TaxID=2734609 RepID=UPI003A876A64